MARDETYEAFGAGRPDAGGTPARGRRGRSAARDEADDPFGAGGLFDGESSAPADGGRAERRARAPRPPRPERTPEQKKRRNRLVAAAVVLGAVIVGAVVRCGPSGAETAGTQVPTGNRSGSDGLGTSAPATPGPVVTAEPRPDPGLAQPTPVQQPAYRGTPNTVTGVVDGTGRLDATLGTPSDVTAKTTRGLADSTAFLAANGITVDDSNRGCFIGIVLSDVGSADERVSVTANGGVVVPMTREQANGETVYAGLLALTADEMRYYMATPGGEVQFRGSVNDRPISIDRQWTQVVQTTELGAYQRGPTVSGNVPQALCNTNPGPAGQSIGG